MRRLLVTLTLTILAGPAFAAWTRVGSLATRGASASGTSVAVPTTAILEVGNVGVCVIGIDEPTGTTDGDVGHITGIVDDAGNTWVEGHEHGNMQTNTAANGALVAIWYTDATVELASGANITVSFGTSTSKAVTCDEFTTAAGATVTEAAGSGGLSNDGADPGSMTVATGVNREHLFIRGSACETNVTTYTADADYVAGTNATGDSGTAATSMGARIETRIATESTSAGSDPTYASVDCASAMIGLNEDVVTGCGTTVALTGAGCP